MKKKFIFNILLCLFYNSVLFGQSPYKLSKETDITITVTGVTLSAIDIVLLSQKTPMTIEELNSLTEENVNSFDRGAISNYSGSAATVSDILLISSIISPLLLFTSSEIRNDAEIISTMCVENALLYFSIPHFAKSTVERYRPYVYNSEVPVQNKLKVESKLSFFSGHTTPAFANAVFLSKVYSEYYPDSKWTPYIWSANLLLASAVGYFRYSSGSHFPTDIITGAVAGTLIGFFITYIHESDETEEPVATPNRPRELFFLKISF
jgi:hypothetical protein